MPVLLEKSEENNLQVSAASYLGGGGDDSISAVDISLDGKVLLGGSLPGYSLPEQINLLNGGAGFIACYDTNTNKLVSSVRLPGAVVDLEVAEKTGNIAVAYSTGVAVLSPVGSKVIWSKSLSNVRRVSITATGKVAVLRENSEGTHDTVTLFSESGEQLQHWSSRSGFRYYRDVVVTDQYGVIIAGFKQARRNLQVSFLQAFGFDGKQKWAAYDFSAAQVDAVKLLADTRCERIAFGRDGRLYATCWVNGGIGYSIYSRDPFDVKKSAEKKIVKYDRYNDSYNTSKVAMTWFAEYDPNSGQMLKGQGLVTRLTSGKGNSITPAEITADEEGNIYVSGTANASLENRTDQKINGVAIAPYAGPEGFLAVISSDLRTRHAWVPIPLSRAAVVSVRESVGAIATTTTFLGTHFTENPVQEKTGGRSDGYFLVLS